MKFADFAGQGPAVGRLMRSVAAGRIAHAYLLAGAAGSGKRTLAQMLAQALFCHEEDKPCGECPACKRFLNGSHPDARTLAPKGKTIGVDDVRSLIDWLSNKPYEGGYRSVVVEGADRMTLSAQNALLKTLEEPTGQTVFWLLAESPAALLATVRSRARIVRLQPLTREACADVLVSRGYSRERALALAGLARGLVGRALAIDADEGFLPLFQRVADSLRSLRGPETVAEVAAPLAEEKERARDILEMLEILGRDRMALQSGAPALACDANTLAGLSVHGSALLRGVARAREMLAANVAWPYALDGLYFSLTEGLS